MIWKFPMNLAVLNDMTKNTMSAHLGLKFTDFGDDWLEATLPVNEKTKQPAGLLHGGASAVLAEELGSIASFLTLGDTGQTAVGIELNCSHLRSARSGTVTGRAFAVKLGRKVHNWNIEIRDELGTLINVSRLTTMILDPAKSGE